MENEKQNGEANESSRFELICACIMAVFASIGVLSSTYSGITGAGWLNGSQMASQAYFWYQSKSIKETIISEQRDFLLSIKDNLNTAKPNNVINQYVTHVNQEMDRLASEKKEILVGSKKLDKSQWVQEVDGQFGQVIGAKEWDVIANQYGTSSDFFTYSTVYIQIALVLGALTIIITYSIPRYTFLFIMIALGTYGTYLCWKGYELYNVIPI